MTIGHWPTEVLFTFLQGQEVLNQFDEMEKYSVIDSVKNIMSPEDCAEYLVPQSTQMNDD